VALKKPGPIVNFGDKPVFVVYESVMSGNKIQGVSKLHSRCL